MTKLITFSALFLVSVISHASANYSDLKQKTIGGAASLSNHHSISADRYIDDTFSMPSQLNLLYASQVAGPMCKRVEVVVSCD